MNRALIDQEKAVLYILQAHGAPWEAEHRCGGLTAAQIAHVMKTAPMVVEASLHCLRDMGRVTYAKQERIGSRRYFRRWYLVKKERDMA